MVSTSSSPSTMVAFLLIVLPLLLTSAFAYPIITEVDESFTKVS
jgi:hypothetical protein